jgi:hypothetical protein
MSRIPDSALRLQWQRRLLKFHAFHGSVQQFCHDEGVSVSSFYQWRAKLDAVRHSAKNKSHTATPRSNAAGGTDKAPHFIPLQLVQGTTCHTPATPPTVVLAGGTRIELPSDDSPVIHAIIRSVMLEDAKLRSEHVSRTADDAGGTQ